MNANEMFEKTKKIALTRGKFALVDSSDFEKLNKYKWHCTWRGYAARCDANGKTIFMHRTINQTPCDKITDHKNYNKLDNRKSNLRTVSCSFNIHHRPQRNKYGKGISFYKQTKKWLAQIGANGKKIFIGYFIDQ